MSTLSHGSDLTLAPTLGPVALATGQSPRQVLGLIAEQGFASVQLDATLPGLRPRELDRSARRDLAATATRCGLTIAGIDFFIPSEHYSDPLYVERAAEAAAGACSLAGDLGRVPVSLNLPVGDADASLTQAMTDTADAYGVTLAIHDEADTDGLTRWLAESAPPHVGVGLDPAALLIRDRDPAEAAQTLSDRIRVARLSDASKGQADGGRQAVGAGSLAVMPYRVSVDLAPDRLGAVVLDGRGLPSPMQAMRKAKAVWDQAAVSF
ncbi:MAG: TIM barrel protein [Planctomycetota bacterium]